MAPFDPVEYYSHRDCTCGHAGRHHRAMRNGADRYLANCAGCWCERFTPMQDPTVTTAPLDSKPVIPRYPSECGPVALYFRSVEPTAWLDCPADIFGAVCVHPSAVPEIIDGVARLTTTGDHWRVSHVATGLALYTSKRYHTACLVARLIGKDPAMRTLLRTDLDYSKVGLEIWRDQYQMRNVQAPVRNAIAYAESVKPRRGRQ